MKTNRRSMDLSRIPRCEGNDRLRWCLRGSGKFDICTHYRKLGILTPHFLGRVSGSLKFLGELLSLCGQLLGIGYLLWTIL